MASDRCTIGMTGFEPAAPSSRTKCATKLRHIPPQKWHYKKGVADFGYDFYLLAIAKLLHGQYFRLLDFYFHTLIQQRHKKILPQSAENNKLSLFHKGLCLLP